MKRDQMAMEKDQINFPFRVLGRPRESSPLIVAEIALDSEEGDAKHSSKAQFLAKNPTEDEVVVAATEAKLHAQVVKGKRVVSSGEDAKAEQRSSSYNKLYESCHK
jgi:hypothetical protein